MKHIRHLTVESVIAETVDVSCYHAHPEIALGRIKVTATNGETTVSFFDGRREWQVGDKLFVDIGHEK